MGKFYFEIMGLGSTASGIQEAGSLEEAEKAIREGYSAVLDCFPDEVEILMLEDMADGPPQEMEKIIKIYR